MDSDTLKFAKWGEFSRKWGEVSLLRGLPWDYIERPIMDLRRRMPKSARMPLELTVAAARLVVVPWGRETCWRMVGTLPLWRVRRNGPVGQEAAPAEAVPDVAAGWYWALKRMRTLPSMELVLLMAMGEMLSISVW